MSRECNCQSTLFIDFGAIESLWCDELSLAEVVVVIDVLAIDDFSLGTSHLQAVKADCYNVIFGQVEIRKRYVDHAILVA